MTEKPSRLPGVPSSLGEAPPGARYRVRPGYALREIAGEHLAIPVSDEAGASGRLAILNTTGRFLFRLLEMEMTLIKILQEKFILAM